jgi:phosphonate transport system permease protein
MPEASARANAAAYRWERHTRGERLARLFLSIALVAAVAASIRSVEVIPEFLVDAPEQVRDLLVRMWPINFGFYPEGVHDALVDTLHIASFGTIIAVILALPVGILSARNLVRNRIVNLAARFILVATRSVNSLIWALLFVAIFGPGALAGTLAIAFRSIGFVGKLVGEALEEADPGPIEALQAVGAPWLSILAKGYWPQFEPTFWSVVLFRWDINIRESSVLGLVGAGGIGMALDTALNLFQWTRVSLILLSIFVVVVCAEIVVTRIRTRIL